jgi:hypothetical protein
MDNPFQKINKIDELVESGADPEVVEGFVLELEDEFLENATAHVQEGRYEQAVREYFLALILPERTSTREEIFGRAVRAFLLLDLNGNEPERLEELSDPRFERLMAELLKRVEEERRRDYDEQFAELDGRSSLRAKDFAALEAVLEKMGEAMPTRYLVARLRLVREKKAQEFFNQIIERFHELAEEEDFESLRAQLDGEILELRKRAVIFSTGIHPVYGEQIREYIERAEELFVKSHTETVIDEIDNAGSKILQDEFAEFKDSIKSDAGPVEILTAVVRGLRIFRDEHVFTEIQRVGAKWAKSEAELRYRLLAIEQPVAALRLVIRSLEIIDGHNGILPSEISDDLRAFLISLKEELTLRVIPRVTPDPPPAPRAQKKRGWLSRLLAWLRALLSGGRKNR